MKAYKAVSFPLRNLFQANIKTLPRLISKTSLQIHVVQCLVVFISYNMATVFESAPSSTTAYIGLIQWADGINDNLVEPTASKVKYDLEQKGWIVKYSHAHEGSTKKTNYSLKLPEGMVAFPEKGQWDWDAVVRDVNGAESLYFEPDGEANIN